jgi:hypothetical protein
MLQRLLMTDPNIGGSPEKRKNAVANYEQFLRIAPELSKEEEVVKSFLTAANQNQALTSFDANSFIETNNNLMKQKLMASGDLPMKV